MERTETAVAGGFAIITQLFGVIASLFAMLAGLPVLVLAVLMPALMCGGPFLLLMLLM